MALLILVVAVQAGWAQSEYGKTEYHIGPDKIRLISGTPFTSNDVELLWSKVVQVQREAGFIQKYLFAAGDIALEAAGQAEAEIRLRHLSRPAEKLDLLLQKLPEKTTLPGDEVIASYSQSRLGIWLDFLWPFLALVFIGVIGGLVAYLFPLSRENYLGLLIAAGMLFLFFICLIFILGFKALAKIFTTYMLYDRYVVSETNFLGFEQRIIPLSMLSDVNVSYPLHKRLLGLGNLVLSVPGLGEELSLKNLHEIASLKTRLQDRSDQIKVNGESREPVPPAGEGGQRFTASPLLLSYLSPVLVALAISALIGGAIGTFLQLKFTGPFYLVLLISLAPPVFPFPFFLYRLVVGLASSFAVEGNRVELTFTFLNKSITSLSTDKIKAIVPSQGIIERLFNTYSVTFHSIGTEQNVKFFSLRDTHENREMIRQIRTYEGSTGGEEKERLLPDLTLPGIVFQHPLVLFVPSVAFFLLALIMVPSLPEINPVYTIGGGLLIGGLVTAGDLWYLGFYYDNCVALIFYDDYLAFEEGYFSTRTYYVVYKDIRNVEYAREPFGEGGWLLVDFSGQGGNKKGSRGQKSSKKGFTFRHLPQVDETAQAVEEIFAGEISPQELARRRGELARQTTAELATARPFTLPYIVMGAGYGLLALMFAGEALQYIGFVIPALVAIFGGALLGGIYRFTIVYTIKENQIESRHWFIFTRTRSIKYQNVDNLEINRNLFDKILGTGTLLVSTTGGSGVELKARFIPNYREFYEKLQDEYNESTTDKTI